MESKEANRVKLQIDTILPEFIKRFQTEEIALKKEARTFLMKDPISGNDTDLASLIATLVTKHIALGDGAAILMSTSPRFDYDIMIPHLKERMKIAGELLQAINLAKAHDLIDYGSEKKLNDLRQENTKLGERIEVLSKQLSECQEGLAFFQKRFPDLGKGNREIGDVNE